MGNVQVLITRLDPSVPLPAYAKVAMLAPISLLALM
jgi:hypothetical protein